MLLLSFHTLRHLTVTRVYNILGYFYKQSHYGQLVREFIFTLYERTSNIYSDIHNELPVFLPLCCTVSKTVSKITFNCNYFQSIQIFLTFCTP